MRNKPFPWLAAIGGGVLLLVAAGDTSHAGSADGRALSLAQDGDPPPPQESDDEDDAKKAEENAAEKAATKARSRRAKERSLRIAEFKLRLAEFDREQAEAAAQLAHEAATSKLAVAEMSYRETRALGEVEAREKVLAVDQARYSAEHAKDELDELVAMYEADEFAEMTKELILKRGRRNLEVAERRMALQVERLQISERIQERKEAEAKQKWDEAAAGVQTAAHGRVRAELQGEISLLEARGTIEGLRDELEALSR